MSEVDNRPAWTGRSGWYEAWFLTCTDPRSGTGYWLRSTLLAPAPGEPTGAVWFARFDPTDPGRTFGIHRRYPMAGVLVRAGDVDVRIGPSTLGSGRLEGSLEGGGHAVRWSLRHPTGDETLRLLPGFADRDGLAPTRPCSPNPATHVTGTIEVDGEASSLEGAPGQQGHLWGRRHAERWAWAHCSDFLDDDAALHALAARGRMGPFGGPYLTSIGLRWEGRWIRLWKLARRCDFGLGRWRLDLGDRRYRLTGRIEAPTLALIRARYEDPDGRPRHCHSSEIASCRLALFERRAGGFEEVAVLESRGTTHAEWAGRTPAPAVAREHVEV
jgi:Tocopherol cyclase